jgi:hypothetical protein
MSITGKTNVLFVLIALLIIVVVVACAPAVTNPDGSIAPTATPLSSERDTRGSLIYNDYGIATIRVVDSTNNVACYITKDGGSLLVQNCLPIPTPQR